MRYRRFFAPVAATADPGKNLTSTGPVSFIAPSPLNATGLVDADPVGGEEIVRRPAPALGLEHPLMLLVVCGGRLREVEVHRVHGFKRRRRRSGSRNWEASCGGGDESNMTRVSGTFYGSGGV